MTESTAVDEDAGVLRSLLEEEPAESRGLVDGTPTTPLVAGSPQLGVRSVVVAQHHAAAAAHQARAAAALEQADAAEEQSHHQHQLAQHVVDNHPSQQGKLPVQESSTSPVAGSAVTEDLSQQQPAQHPIPISIPPTTAAHPENDLPPTPGTAELAPTTPPSICLCQQPARIPRPRNGETISH